MKYLYDYFQYIYEKNKIFDDLCDIIMNNFNNDIHSFTIHDYSSETFVKHKRSLKVKNLNVKFNFIESDIERCDGLCNANNSLFINDHLVNVHLTFTIYMNKMSDNFKKYIYSIINHEIIHLYQIYNLYKGDKFKPEHWIIGGTLPQLRLLMKSDYGKNILSLIYHSLSHEIYAQLRQYYIYLKDNKNYLKIDFIINELNNFMIKNDINDVEKQDIELIRITLLNNIISEVDNKKYIRDIMKSLWNIENIDIFLMKLKERFKKQALLLKKKQAKIDISFNIKENIYHSLPTNFEEMEINYFFHLDDIISDVLFYE